MGSGGGGEGEGGGRGEGVSAPLEGLCESVGNQWEEWVSWADEGDVWEASRVPGGFFVTRGGDGGDGGGKGGREGGEAGAAEAEGVGEEGASSFQRLLLVKAFREDQLLRCIAKFVGEKLGAGFADRCGN